MSLSLSSLLNPSPDAEGAPQTSPSTSSSTARNDTLPPIQYVQSPEQQFVASPPSAHPQHHQPAYPPTTQQDAAHALASLAGNSAPPPLQSQWYPAQGTAESGYDNPQRSNSFERRPGSSGYSEPIQLPPPPSNARQNSSPTLDQYHVASRSPDQRRQSMISPAQPNFTLPPIQSISPTQPLDHSRRPPSSHGQSSIYDNAQLPVSRVESHMQSESEFQKEPVLSLDDAQPSYDTKQSPAVHLPKMTSDASETMDSSPAAIKQEALGTPRASSPADKYVQSAVKSDNNTPDLKPFTTMKAEHSPLRDSSVPVPSTEAPASEPAPSKKRPAPAKTKKGTATSTIKKAPPSKKRKLEKSKPIDRALTPLKALSSKGATPATSSPAPSTRSVSAEPDDDVYEDDDDDDESGDAGSSDDVYCLCRKPDTGTFMIGCDGTCDDWFHGKCVGIEERDKNLIDKYVCPNCTKVGAGQTTWKRMCRRSGCRLPARVGKAGKGGKEGGGSKYCSDECGVLYFREMVARTRGKEELGKHRHSRRRNSLSSPTQSRDGQDDDLGARGGVLAAGELKALVNASKSADDFKKLGDGVLSPPATPDSKGSPAMTKDSKGDFTEPEIEALADISKQKDEARRKHQLLKDRIKFVTMVKQAQSRTATEKELKPKDYCGYDSRIEWTEDQFRAWRNSKGGRQAFDLETLATEKNGNVGEGGDTDMEDGVDDFEVCDRKKCARHLEWGKLAVDDLRFEMADNADHLRALEREEREIKERAALRSKAGRLEGEGRVEVHGLGILGVSEPMDMA